MDKKKAIILSAAAVIVAAVLFLLLRSCGRSNTDSVQPEDTSAPSQSGFSLVMAEGISDERPAQRTQEEVLADLNRQVADGMITMSMNPDPIFANGAAEGNVLIENDAANSHAQVIQIFRDDTGGLIYTSGMIPVGKFLNTDALDVHLDAGDYPCTAYFNAVDEETGQILGTGAVKITVHVRQ